MRDRTQAAWRPIEIGAPDFHRRNEADPRSYVSGVFHQFNFFPWNDDPFRLFSRLEPVFEIRNRLAGLPVGAHMEPGMGDDASIRIAVQHYPVGGGRMNLHRDPVGAHQAAVCLLVLSEWGVDYLEGGLVVGSEGGFRPERVCARGDLLWLDPNAVHGIESVDPHAPLDWFGANGRWSALLATNRLSGASSGIGDSVDLGPG